MFDREMRYIRVSRRWRTNYVPGGSQPDRRVARRRPSGDPEIWKDAHRRGLRGRGRAGGWQLGTCRRLHPLGALGNTALAETEQVNRRDRNFLRRYHRSQRGRGSIERCEARLRTALEAASMGTFERDLANR